MSTTIQRRSVEIFGVQGTFKSDREAAERGEGDVCYKFSIRKLLCVVVVVVIIIVIVRCDIINEMVGI